MRYRIVKIPRDAITGQIVTLAYALANPRTTVIETAKVPTPSPRKKSK